MRTRNNILLSFLMMSVMTTGVFASTVITSTSVSTSATKKIAEKYSLKNISTFTFKTSTFKTLRPSLTFKGLTTTSTGITNKQSSYLKYNKGNISFVIPYKHKVILPRFKTPAPNQP